MSAVKCSECVAHGSPEEDIQRAPAKELVFSDSEDEGDVSGGGSAAVKRF